MNFITIKELQTNQNIIVSSHLDSKCLNLDGINKSLSIENAFFKIEWRNFGEMLK